MKNRIAIAAVLPVVLACVACDGGNKSATATPAAAVAAPNTAPAPAPNVATTNAPAKHAAAAHPSTTHKTVASATDTTVAPSTRVAAATACVDCGTVSDVHSVKRKGEGGAVGMIGGAVVGGLLGHQVGGGTGKTLATVGGAAAGAFAGNEVQKQVSSKTVWVTTVKMRDGSTQTFEQEAQPSWKSGESVRVKDGAIRSL
jgi:outer membrane lipoprotein SlyB